MKTKILTIKNSQAFDAKNLEAFSLLLRQGETVAFPTETVYGIGANAFDDRGIDKIFIAKGRPRDNPLIVHIAKCEDLIPLVKEIPEKAKLLMAAFWPGPLTLIMKKSEVLSKKVTGGLNTVAIRFPSHPIARALIVACGSPIAAPSANLSGRPSATKGEHVLNDLNNRVAGIIISEDAKIGLESTVIDMTKDVPIILRPGSVTLLELETILGTVDLSEAVTKNISLDKVASPGMKYTHYAPKGDLTIVKGNPREIQKKIKEKLKQFQGNAMSVGILASDETMNFYHEGYILSLGSQNNPKEMAKNLFSRLRSFDDLGVQKIFAEDIPLKNESLALINRLYKAAGYTFI